MRSVFIRACQIHCEAKALVHMKFAAFEESVGQTEKAKVILDRLIMRYPLMIGKSFHEIYKQNRDFRQQTVTEN